MPAAHIAIVGGGIAGVSLAWELSRRGVRPVVLVEREELPGTHASGRNAALVLQNVTDESNCLMAQMSVLFYTNPPADLGPPPEFRRVGSLLLASGPNGRARMERDVAQVTRLGLKVLPFGLEEVARRVPPLDITRLAGAVLCPNDGIMDIHGLLQAFLRGAQERGVEVLTGCEAQAIETHRNAVSGLLTTRGRIGAKLVVNAAGGWAGGLGATAGAPLPLRPTRRHIAVTERAPGVDPEWPYVWDVDASAYFRPESGGLLFSGCDIEDAPDCDETVRPEKIEAAAGKLLTLAPSLGGLGVARSWAGIRTLTPDDRFAIGYDRRLKGLFWMAGLGGHGITAAPAAAQVAADVLLEGRSGLLDAGWVDPMRLLKG